MDKNAILEFNKQFNRLVDDTYNRFKNEEYICETCNKSIKLINKDKHETSKTHIKKHKINI